MSASTEANMEHGPKQKSKMKNRAEKSKTEAEDAKASQQEVATIQLIDRSEELKKLKEDLISIIEHFMEDGFQALDRLIEDFEESDGDTTESEFSESEPEMLPKQTFPEKEPVPSTSDIKQTTRPEKTQAVYPKRKVVTFSEGNQTVAPEEKPSASDPDLRPQTIQDRKRTVSRDSQDLRREQGTQTDGRGLLRIPLRETLRALGRRLQEAPGEE